MASKKTKKAHYFDSKLAQKHYTAWKESDCEDSKNALAIMVQKMVVRLASKSFNGLRQDSADFQDITQILNAHVWVKLADNKYNPTSGTVFAWATSVVSNRLIDMHRAKKQDMVSLTAIENTALTPQIRDTTEDVATQEAFDLLVLKIQGAFPVYLPRKCVMDLLSEVVDHQYKISQDLMTATNRILRQNRVSLQGMSRATFLQMLVAFTRNESVAYNYSQPNTTDGTTLTRVLESIIGEDNTEAFMAAFSGMTLVVPEPVKRKTRRNKPVGR